MAREPELVSRPAVDRWPMFIRWLRRAVAGLVLLFALALLVDLILRPSRYQWDFATYYHAGQAARAGLNPYDLGALSAVAGTEVGFPFAYSPILLPICTLLSRLDFLTAYRLFLALKVAGLVVLLWLWKTRFLDDEAGLSFYLVCLFGFGGAIYVDLAAGNVSIFEQLALWSAFACLRSRRPVAFGLLVLAASLFKLTPILFLVLLVAPGLPRRLGVFLGSLAAFAVGQGLTYLAAPQRYRDFLAVASQLDDRGAINPSTLALVRDLGEALARRGLVAPAAVEWMAYAVFAAGVVCLTWFALRRAQGDDPRLSIFLVCLAFALIMPRFKNYAYILLLVPAYFVVRRILADRVGETGLVLLLLSQAPPMPFGLSEAVRALFWGYYPWLLALSLWTAAAIRLLLSGGAGPEAAGGRAEGVR